VEKFEFFIIHLHDIYFIFQSNSKLIVIIKFNFFFNIFQSIIFFQYLKIFSSSRLHRFSAPKSCRMLVAGRSLPCIPHLPVTVGVWVSVKIIHRLRITHKSTIDKYKYNFNFCSSIN